MNINLRTKANALISLLEKYTGKKVVLKENEAFDEDEYLKQFPYKRRVAYNLNVNWAIFEKYAKRLKLNKSLHKEGSSQLINPYSLVINTNEEETIAIKFYRQRYYENWNSIIIYFKNRQDWLKFKNNAKI